MTADALDQASDIEQLLRDDALAEVRYRASKAPKIEPMGICHNCQAPVGLGERYCDADCRDDFDARRNAATRRGIVD